MNWLEIFRPRKTTKLISENELFDRNLQFISGGAFLAIFINFIHILLFVSSLESSQGKEYFWRMGIILSHGFSLIYFLIIGIILNSYISNKKINKEYIKFIFILTYIVLVSLGVSLTILDQIVTNSISPYMFSSVCLPFLILINPRVMSTITLIGFSILYFLFPLTQSNPDIVLSNRVNGFSFAGMGIFLSIFMWNNVVDRFAQARVIQKQKEDLEDSYKLSIEAREKLKLANLTKDKFFSIIAHDLRGPFGSIFSFAEVMESEVHNLSKETILEYIGMIKSSAKNTHLLLENLLDWANAQTGQIVYSPSNFLITEVIDSISNLMRGMAQKKNIRLLTPKMRPIEVFLDKKMIETILRNIISNSIKFTPFGGEIDIQLTVLNQKIQIQVTDSGIGIPEETLDSIFRIDRTVTSRGTSGEIGSGLGMVLVKEFLDKNNGEIRILSKLGKGTEITLEFPNVL